MVQTRRRSSAKKEIAKESKRKHRRDQSSFDIRWVVVWAFAYNSVSPPFVRLKAQSSDRGDTLLRRGYHKGRTDDQTALLQFALCPVLLSGVRKLMMKEGEVEKDREIEKDGEIE